METKWILWGPLQDFARDRTDAWWTLHSAADAKYRGLIRPYADATSGEVLEFKGTEEEAEAYLKLLNAGLSMDYAEKPKI